MEKHDIRFSGQLGDLLIIHGRPVFNFILFYTYQKHKEIIILDGPFRILSDFYTNFIQIL
jgi:hypothetical protein